MLHHIIIYLNILPKIHHIFKNPQKYVYNAKNHVL
jgi:hypothetical protein